MGELCKEERESSFYWHLIPSELKLEEIIKANPPKFVYSFDFFVHLVHLTIEIPAKNKTLRRKDGYVPLCSKILQGRHRNYNLHLQYLVDNKILEAQPNYKPGVKSRSYRISESFLKDRLMEIMVSDKNLIKQLAKQYRLDFKLQKKYGYLQKWFNDKVQVNVDEALQHCYQLLKKSSRDDLYQIYQQTYGKVLMIRMIHHKQFWFRVDAFGNRLHTNFTNLSKDLKPFIKYDGQNLVSIDIKNAQPYMSLKLLAKKYPDMVGRVVDNSTIPIPIMLVKGAETLIPIDVQKYAGLVVNGVLYEFMEAEMRKEFGDKYFTREYIFDLNKLEVLKNDKTPREMVKDVMFQVFFSKNDSIRREKKLFKKLFPNVMQAFEDCKGKKHVSIKNRHKMLSKELQRTESHVMLDKIAKEISKQKPNLLQFTIHDSIVTTVGNEEFVKQMMSKILLDEIGFVPTVQIEYWCQECSDVKLAA